MEPIPWVSHISRYHATNRKRLIDRIRGFPSSTFLLKFFPNLIPESPPILSSPWNSWGSCLVPACQEATFFPLSLIPSNSLILIFCFSLHNFIHIFTFSHHHYYFIIRPLIYRYHAQASNRFKSQYQASFFHRLFIYSLISLELEIVSSRGARQPIPRLLKAAP